MSIIIRTNFSSIKLIPTLFTSLQIYLDHNFKYMLLRHESRRGLAGKGGSVGMEGAKRAMEM